MMPVMSRCLSEFSFQEGCHLSSGHFGVRTEVVVDRSVATEGYSGGSRFVNGILENVSPRGSRDQDRRTQSDAGLDGLVCFHGISQRVLVVDVRLQDPIADGLEQIPRSPFKVRALGHIVHDCGPRDEERAASSQILNDVEVISFGAIARIAVGAHRMWRLERPGYDGGGRHGPAEGEHNHIHDFIHGAAKAR